MSYQPEPKFQAGDYVYYYDFLYHIDRISWQKQSQEWFYLIQSETSVQLVKIATGNEYFRKA